MKKVLALVLSALMIFGLVSCGGSTTQLTMGTGGTGGTYYSYGNVISTFMADASGVKINVVSTDGSAADIYGIDDGIYQLATVQSDVMAYAYQGERTFSEYGKIDSFRVIGGLYEEAVQIVTLDSSIKTVADLKGKAVSVGAAGSGVYFNAMDVLNAYGIAETDISAQYLSFSESTDAMKDGKIDAAFIVAGAPTTSVTELSTSSQVYLVSIEDEIADKLIADCPYYNKCTIKSDVYGTPDDVSTISVKATMIVSSSVSEEVVYNLTKGIFENAEAITAQHAKGAELSIENAVSGMAVPFHKGAAKYFAEKGITVSTD